MGKETELVVRAWSAHATMLNRAQELERAAEQLRRVAAALHRALDPPEREPSE